jgi:hypothetical protein
MANEYTRLADVIVPEVYDPYVSMKTKELSQFFSSGIVKTDASLSQKVAGGGRTFNASFWNDLVDNEAAVVSDDPNEKIEGDKITAGKDVVVRQVRAKKWSSMDLTSLLAGSDAATEIADKTAAWWARFFDQTCFSLLEGAMASNIANNGSDMLEYAVDNNGNPLPISFNAIMDARMSLGDAYPDVTNMVIHPQAWNILMKDEKTVVTPNSKVNTNVMNYNGYNVILSERVKVVDDAGTFKYSTYIVKSGALAFGEAPVKRGTVVERDEDAGNGGGAEFLHNRKNFCAHIPGFRWTDANCAKEFPSWAELEDGDNWLRVYPERKQIPIIELVTTL